MTTLYWHFLLAVKRWCCRVLGHRDVVTRDGRFEITRCRRCWKVGLERVAG